MQDLHVVYRSVNILLKSSDELGDYDIAMSIFLLGHSKCMEKNLDSNAG